MAFNQMNNGDKAYAYYNPLTKKTSPERRSKLPTFESFGHLDKPRRKKAKFEDTTGIRPPGQGDKRNLVLEDESTPILYEMARTAAGLGNTSDVKRIVEHLVRDRKEKPSLRLYSALILSNVNPSEGAAWRVASLLEEMVEEGLIMDVGICHDVLKVLSVHLDYLLRADILEYMRQRWLTLTPPGHQHVAAALFREGQLEMGLEKLDEMRDESIHIPPWLMDLATYLLAENGEFNDALRLLNDQIAFGDMNISSALWNFVLDHASAAFHYEATSYCWKSQVEPGYLNPPSGTCLNVLTTASRKGDAALATSVFHVMGKRGSIFTAIHYEQLLNTYLTTKPIDLRAALTVLTIMSTVKLEPNTTSTRALFNYLKSDKDKTFEAFEILTELNEAHRPVPIAALNLVIEAHVQHKDLHQALTIYKAMHTFEPLSAASDPHKHLANVDTFNHLLRGCRRGMAEADADHDTAVFLVSEMIALNIKPNALTYDRLVLVCLGAHKLDDAWRYFEEMEGLDMFPRLNTATVLAKELAAAGDKRCWDVLERVHDLGMVQGRIRLDIERAWAGWERNKDGNKTGTDARVATDAERGEALRELMRASEQQ